MTPAVGKAVEQGESAAAIQAAAVADGMNLMWLDGLTKAKLGLTTLEEVNRIVAVQATEPESVPIVKPTKTVTEQPRLAA